MVGTGDRVSLLPPPRRWWSLCWKVVTSPNRPFSFPLPFVQELLIHCLGRDGTQPNAGPLRARAVEGWGAGGPPSPPLKAFHLRILIFLCNVETITVRRPRGLWEHEMEYGNDVYLYLYIYRERETVYIYEPRETHIF